MTQFETPALARTMPKNTERLRCKLRGRSNRGVPIPQREAIFAAIELALAVQSGQFALRAPANRAGPAKALS
jgi:hypothetical protein